MDQVNSPSLALKNLEPLLDLLRKNQQQTLIDHWSKLTKDQKNEFLEEIGKLNLPLVFDLYQRSHRQDRAVSFSKIKPAQIISLPNSAQEWAEREEARRLGEELLRSQEIAVMVVAGGQGSRLGFVGPKGKFPITPIKKKSLFQLFAETLRALQIRYRATIPFLIMTNPENHLETRQFFEMNRYWGLSPENVFFFDQGMLPTLTLEGDLILRDETHLLTNPDGHGGSLKALYESRLLHMLMDRRYSELFYFQVDNPLVKIADPVFLGFHRKSKAEISTKVVRRTHFEEKVGIYLEIDGRPGIIEYSDFPAREYEARDEKGQIRYWAANTAIHIFSLAFIERLNLHGFALPYHRAIKAIEVNDSAGRKIKMNGIKFETFVFDAIPLAQRSCCLEVAREEEFSPVKNREGIDSPATAQAALLRLHRRWLQEAGIDLGPEGRVEISPLFALDPEELRQKLKGQKLRVEGDLYLG